MNKTPTMTEEGTSNTVSKSVNKTTSYEDNDDDNIIHSKITSAMRARVPHFQKESSSLTLEGVRRLLEKDMELDKFSLDKHKRFLRECLAECLKAAEDVNTSKNSGETGETNLSSAKEAAKSTNREESINHINEPGSGGDEKMEDSPVILGLLTGDKKSESKMKDTLNDEVVLNETTVKKAMWKRASYIIANLENLTMTGLRRLLEQDLKLEQRAIDTYKDFISEELDEVIESAEASESKSVSKKKNVKKSNSNASNRVKTENSSESFGNRSDEEEEDVTPHKKIVSKRKAQSSEGLKKRKRPENNAKSRKKNVKSKKTKSEDNCDDNDSVVDSEDKNSQSSAEKPTKKREISTPGYGKHAEHLKSVIKACGLSVPPVIYKKVRQFPEGKREAQLIKELEEILSREGLSSRPSEKEINDVRKRKEKAKELEGIDTSNIISSSRSRRSTTSFILPPKTKIPDIDDSGEESDDDNNEDNGSESDVSSEDDADSD